MGTGGGRGAAGRFGVARFACAAFLLLSIGPGAASAAVIEVDDNGDAVANTGECTLREAILNANNDSQVNAAVDECEAGGGPDTINFGAAMVITPATPLPDITSQITIDGTSVAGGCANGAPQIRLTGSAAGAGANGFDLSGATGGSTICGFRIDTFNAHGIEIATNSNTITGNILRNNTDSGVRISGGDGNTVRGSFIGVAGDGVTPEPNLVGITVANGSVNNVIGGAAAADRNLISGNTQVGITISGSSSSGNRVEGNRIGTDVNGTAAVPNGQQGVRISSDSTLNVIGGDSAGEGNLISGNTLSGVQITGPDNQVLGNFVGTRVTGDVALPNGGSGVDGVGGTGNEIGAPDTSADATGGGPRNLISGNGFNGVRLAGATTANTTVEGNFIGTDVEGFDAIPNGTGVGSPWAGVVIENNVAGSRIGGAATGAGNVISGNRDAAGDGYGVRGFASVGPGNTIEGNVIGPDRTGIGPLTGPSNSIGIQLDGDGTTVGGVNAGQGNVIAINDDDGVFVIAGDGNPILRNSIWTNAITPAAGDIGIDLFAGVDGITPNDNLDPDIGSNNLQNFPVLTGAQANSVDTTVQGTLNSLASTTFRIEFFSSTGCDDAADARTFLGSANVTTDGSGNAAIAATVGPAPEIQAVTATATRLTGTTPVETSEISACQAIEPKAEPPAPDPGGGGGGGGGGGTPDPGGGGGGGGGGGAADTRDPLLDLGGDEKQSKDDKVKVEASCDEDCAVDATGTIKVPEFKKSGKVKGEEKFDLRGADAKDLLAGEETKLKLEFKSKTEKAVKKAFKEKEKSTAKVTVTATDAAGNQTDEKFEIKVKK